MTFEEASVLISSIQIELVSRFTFLNDWMVVFDSAKRRAGLCRISTQEISVSINHIESNEESVVRDTIYHEFAHAIAYHLYGDKGHGKHWKKIALLIGAVPKARGHFNLPEARWLLVHICRKTKTLQPIAERFRRNKRISHYHLTGRPETKGELFFLEKSHYIEYKHGQIQQSQLVLVQ